MSAPRAVLSTGLAALAKAAVLVVGVPLALVRLWFLAPVPRHLSALAPAGSVSAWAHLAVAAAGIAWALATASLAHGVWSALRRHESLETGSWSSRWAGAIAGLVLLATAGTSLAATGSAHPATVPVATVPAVRRPAVRPPPAAATRRAAPTLTVRPDECLADVAVRATGCVDDWPLLARLNLGRRQTDGGRMLDPARVRAGWLLAVPPRAASSATNGTGETPAASKPTPAPQRRLAELALLGLGIVTTCALARRLRNLRRASSSGRRPQERLVAPARRFGEARAALEPFADAPLIDWIDGANSLLWRLVRDQDTEAPEVRLVRAGPDGIELLLAAPRPEAPWPFLPRRDGRWWVLDPAAELGDFGPLGPADGRLLPSLVPLGDDEQASYLLVVGRGRRLAVDGPAELVDRTLEAIVASLRTVPWAEQLAIELVGIAPPPPEEQCYQLSPSTEAVLAELAAEGEPTTAATVADRWRREPLIVVGREANSPGCERVLAAAGRVAGIVAAGQTGTERLVVGADHAVLQPYGIELSAVTPTTGQFALLDGLLAEARRAATVVPVRPGPTTDRARLATVPVAGRVEVRLLRPEPSLVGLATAPCDRDAPRVVELLAFLALHGGVAPVEATAAALFARSEPASRRARTANVALAARTALGPGPGGRRLLAHHRDELVLDPAVTCDLVRCRRALAAAPHVEPPVAEELLVGALDLVEGQPLGGVAAGYAWFAAEALGEICAAEIVDGAHHLATLALASGRFELARWAIARGRLADAGSEILARDLMAVAGADDDAGAARAAFRELEATLERLGGGEPSLETRALLEALDTAL
ncbi:MAG: bacterial transcriptional activator domain-containing protein [Acidimicrobiales bacterium]|jgi:DNA-binding SARP family transcriptional activator